MKKENFITNHPLVKHLIWMLVITAGILILVAIFIKIYSRHGQEYEMDNLAGLQYHEVTLNNPLQLRFVIVDSIYNSDTDPGIILSQDPLPGTLVKKNRKVYLTISSREPESVIMPDLIDMSLRQAVSQLMSEGLTIGHLYFVESQYRNAIQSQSIKGRKIMAGQKINRGSVIDLSVGKGPNDLGTVVPVVIGKTREQAQRALFSSSLNISEHFNSGVVNKAAAMIYKQEPVCSDIKYPLGSSVSVWYCNPSDYSSKRRSADREIDSLKRVADSLRHALELEESYQFDDMDFSDIDDIW